MDPKVLFNIGYGLYVVTSNDGVKDNGLIVNTVTQLTSTPERVAVTVNKSNYSHDVIKNSGIMNVCPIAESAPFKVFEDFGFKSGRDTNKLEGYTPVRASNGLAVLPTYINSYMSLKVEDYVDLGTHGMFICSLTDGAVFTSEPTMSYAYYHKNVKPKPEAKKQGGWLCTICGYIHDEAEIPDDFECPLCKHGREVFVPV
ncbi:MAG: flavin reductase [Clostridia bacterium]|nr:flavin reductase [Clostridia bacterium]